MLIKCYSILRVFVKIVILSFSLIYSCQATATLITTPNEAEFTNGGSQNGLPFNFPVQPLRYQQLYSADLFSGVSGFVSDLRFRVNGIFGDIVQPSFSGELFNLEIRLSNTSINVPEMTKTFANNITSPQTLVLDGVISLSGTGGLAVNPFDIIIDIDDTFFYDGVSNLLLDITTYSGQAGSQFDSISAWPQNDQIGRVFGFGSNLENGNGLDTSGLVTQFNIVDVPEPSINYLLILGVFLMLLVRTYSRYIS